MKYYEDLLKLEVFTFVDARAVIGAVETTKKVLQRLKKNGLIKHIQRQLYAAVNLENRDALTNRYVLASKLNEDAHLVCHSAFEIHGYANQVSFEVWVASKKRFNSFEFEGIHYRYAGKGLDSGVIKYKLNSKIKVTDLERTIIDSLKNIGYAGGSHELDECLSITPVLDIQKLESYLRNYDLQYLYKKAGFFLERHQHQLGIKPEFLKICLSKCGPSIRYLDDEAKKGPGKLIKSWGLIVPVSLVGVKEDGESIV